MICCILFKTNIKSNYPQITWLDSHNVPIKKHIETIVETLPDGKRKNTRSILRMKMSRSHHNTNLTCEAQNSAESSPGSTSILLRVEFAPTVTLQHSPEVIREGDTVKYKCLVSANPGNVSYQWSVDGDEQLLGGDHSVLVLPGVTRSSNTQIVKCRVGNMIGYSEETDTLDIHCKS